MVRFAVEIPRPDDEIEEISYAFNILIDGALVVQIRKRYVGDAVAKGLAEYIHKMLTERSA